MGTEFVEGWVISHTLGEGAYGEVKLVVNKHTGDCVAMKVVDLSKNASVRASVEKEVKIHKLLKDKHLIRCYGSREQSNIFYIFLEYACHGELFDRIEPDIGMPPADAQKFMKQLIAGVSYLHRCGVTHRDIKPENLLLDKDDNLKISDLGLATVFRYNGMERTLEKKCGTLPYVAPEVLVRRYAAAPADIWSCGIVLVAMLAGVEIFDFDVTFHNYFFNKVISLELPWDKPSADCEEYIAWKKGDYMNRPPWSKLDTIPLSLIKIILNHLPSARPTPQQIAEHR
ncbi:Putative Serine/threonine-protein kinase grp [Halyomorpha halys]|nr:Putative Serine/threonine-protein kinase grp [Halyomorpha halys]